MPFPLDRRPCDPVNLAHPGIHRQFGQDEQLGRNVESNPTHATATMSSPSARPPPPPPPLDQRACDSMEVAHDGRPGHEKQLGHGKTPRLNRDLTQHEHVGHEHIMDEEYVSCLHKVIVSRFFHSLPPCIPLSLPPLSLHLVACPLYTRPSLTSLL